MAFPVPVMLHLDSLRASATHIPPMGSRALEHRSSRVWCGIHDIHMRLSRSRLCLRTRPQLPFTWWGLSIRIAAQWRPDAVSCSATCAFHDVRLSSKFPRSIFDTQAFHASASRIPPSPGPHLRVSPSWPPDSHPCSASPARLRPSDKPSRDLSVLNSRPPATGASRQRPGY